MNHDRPRQYRLSPRARAVAFPLVVATLALATACNGVDPSIRVNEQRRDGGNLQSVTIDGSGFSKNGDVRINFSYRRLEAHDVLSFTAKTITADGDGNFHYVKGNPFCPDLQGDRASLIAAIADDLASNQSRRLDLHPGRESDCVAF